MECSACRQPAWFIVGMTALRLRTRPRVRHVAMHDPGLRSTVPSNASGPTYDEKAIPVQLTTGFGEFEAHKVRQLAELLPIVQSVAD